MSASVILDAQAAADAPCGDTIDSVRHPAVARVADVLRSRAHRPRTVLIDDAENIAQAIRARVRIISVYTTPGERCTGIGLDVPDVDRHVLTEEVMRSLFHGEKRGRVFALAQAPAPASWRDIAAARGDVVVLDGVSIAGNIGAIIRSACAFGAAALVLIGSGITSIYDRRIIRASRGLIFSIPVLLASRNELELFVRTERMPLVSMTADAAAPLCAIAQIQERVAILMGSERTGVSHTLGAMADQCYAVPMTPGVDSLNVSVAAALALYERARAGQEGKSSSAG